MAKTLIELKPAPGLVRQTVASQLRALLTIARKEWLIFRRYPSWVMAFVIWPVLFPFGYIFTAKALGGPGGATLSTFTRLAGTTDYISFIVVGSTLWMWLNITLWDVGFQLRNEQMRGTLESNWLCPVWRISIMIGSSFTKLATATMLLVITALEFRIFFGVNLLRGGTTLLVLLLLIIPSIYGLGIAFGSMVLRFKEANAMVFLVRGLFMVFCGITYPLEVLPGWMRSVAAFLPLTYAIRDMRAVILSGATFADILPDVQKLAVFAVVLPIAGFAAFAAMERRARRAGDLGQY
jgi:ABC-2 type transport system permease protein